MRTSKKLYPEKRMIYQPELSCLHCGEELKLCNYLAWDKTVQTLEGVLAAASRPGYCANEMCKGHHTRIVSGEGQQVALPGSSYGYDVLARIGWLREKHHATYQEIWEEIVVDVAISEAHVRYLHQQVYLPLLACHERKNWQDRLAQTAAVHGGIIIEMDGLMPEAGEPQIWFIREILSGVVLRSGWLDRVDEMTFKAFLKPVADLNMPVLAVLSDKQSGLVPAVAKCLPEAWHQFCQPHYLRNLAEPLADRDTAFKNDLRKTMQDKIRILLRPEPTEKTPDAAILTTTGALPTPTPDPSPPAETSAPIIKADTLVDQILGRVRYLLTNKGRPPVRLGGIETYQGLRDLQLRLQKMLTHHYDARLAELSDALECILPNFAARYSELQQGATWIEQIKDILAADASGTEVAQSLRAYLNALLALPDRSPFLCQFSSHLDTVSQSYWPGLFHCYDLEPLPSSNNDLESRFRLTRHRLLRISGQKGRTRRALLRLGTWELLPRPPTEAARLAALRQVAHIDFRIERQRLRAHLARFRLHTRSAKRAASQLDALQDLWLSLPPSTG